MAINSGLGRSSSEAKCSDGSRDGKKSGADSGRKMRTNTVAHSKLLVMKLNCKSESGRGSWNRGEYKGSGSRSAAHTFPTRRSATSECVCIKNIKGISNNVDHTFPGKTLSWKSSFSSSFLSSTSWEVAASVVENPAADICV